MRTENEVRTGETGGKTGKLKDQGCGRIVNKIASNVPFLNLYSATLMGKRHEVKERREGEFGTKSGVRT